MTISQILVTSWNGSQPNSKANMMVGEPLFSEIPLLAASMRPPRQAVVFLDGLVPGGALGIVQQVLALVRNYEPGLADRISYIWGKPHGIGDISQSLPDLGFGRLRLIRLGIERQDVCKIRVARVPLADHLHHSSDGQNGLVIQTIFSLALHCQRI